MLLKSNSPQITVAIDAQGGDHGYAPVVAAVNFALTLYSKMNLLIYGSNECYEKLVKAKIDPKRYEFIQAPMTVPADASPKDVLDYYQGSSMALAINAVKEGRAQAAVSAGGTGPLVTMARHYLGSIGHVRPALAARMPYAMNRFTLMLDLGANAQSDAKDLADFALLGSAAAKAMFNLATPRVALLNVGTEDQKGSHVVREARDLIMNDRSIYLQGYLEANRIFCGDADVIVTDGFTGNVALKAAEGVAEIFGKAAGLRKFIAKMARPDWLLPWQYNGSVLLGVDGVVIKSHGNAGEEAFAVAMVEAARCAQSPLLQILKDNIEKSRG